MSSLYVALYSIKQLRPAFTWCELIWAAGANPEGVTWMTNHPLFWKVKSYLLLNFWVLINQVYRVLVTFFTCLEFLPSPFSKSWICPLIVTPFIYRIVKLYIWFSSTWVLIRLKRNQQLRSYLSSNNSSLLLKQNKVNCRHIFFQSASFRTSFIERHSCEVTQTVSLNSSLRVNLMMIMITVAVIVY